MSSPAVPFSPFGFCRDKQGWVGVLLRVVLLTETLILRKEPEHVAWFPGWLSGSGLVRRGQPQVPRGPPGLQKGS